MSKEAKIAEFVAFANILADTAREVILPYWRKPIKVISKVEDDRVVSESPVTIADRQAEESMRKLITDKYPDHGIFGEEYGTVRVDAEYVWVLDPIDGTKSFITGKPLFGTLIALLQHGSPILGVIDQCVLKERWVGVSGRQTTLNNKPVKTTGVTALSEAMMYATTPHMFTPGLEEACYALMCDTVKRPLYGADCYAYALVASGFGPDLVVEADLGLYDYAALVPIVRGAGGVMTDWTGKDLCLSNHEACKGRVLAAANASLHAQALSILNANARASTSSSSSPSTITADTTSSSSSSSSSPSAITDTTVITASDSGTASGPSTTTPLGTRAASSVSIPSLMLGFMTGTVVGITIAYYTSRR